MNSKVEKERDTRLSKRLSYLLRHGALREGLCIKSDGFVKVEELLKNKLSGYSQKDVERVVANDEKQRYSLANNDGILEIRANQGHSISEICDLTLKLVTEDPDFEIIHGTYLENWPEIRSKGLSRMKRNHIHFAKGLNFICGLRKSAELYIYINFKKAQKAGLKFVESENGVILCSGDARGIIETGYFSKIFHPNSGRTYFLQRTKMMKRCEICEIDLDEHDFPSHVGGKKHLKKMDDINFKKGLIEKSIFVSRLPPSATLEDVLNFFKQFGVVQRCKLDPNFAIIEFAKKETVHFLLNRPIWMGQHKLDIKRRRLVESRPTHLIQQEQQDKDRAAAEIVFADLKTTLQSETTFDGELSAFLKAVTLDEDELEEHWQSLYDSLVEALMPAFPNGEISRFGSSVTGLSFKGSDFDVYLNIGEPIYDDEEKNRGWTPRTIFKEVKFLLYKKKNVFERIVPIPRAKTPIIKFGHIPTSTNCDISFKHGLGVINSRLIKQLLNTDVRLKPLMIIIKFWAKTFELSGCGKFSNYAVVMMVIFYLQQPEVKLLPAIVELQRTCEPEYHWNWQVNFDQKPVLPPSTNDSSIVQLLHGFFKFYVNFPFDKKLISPLDGCAHERLDFSKVCAEKGGDADHLALGRPVCLQDPIELDCNVTASVSSKVLETFRSFCAVAVEVCEAALETNGKPFLLNLYTTLPAPIRMQNQSIIQITITPRKTLLAGLPRDFDASTDKETKKKNAENNWFSLVQRLVEEAMKRVFKLEVHTIKNDREVKQQKVDATSDVHSKDNDKIVFECRGYYCVITGRRSKSFCIDPTLGPIDKEALISDDLVNKQKANGVKPTKIDFTCTMVREQNPARMVLWLKDRDSAKKRFRSLASFMTTKLPSVIEKELIHMLQYNKR